MKQIFLVCFLLLPVLLRAEVPAAQPELQTLDRLVGRWMELRTVIAEERRTWAEQREHWEHELQLLKQQDQALQKEIEEKRGFASSVEQERAAALSEKAALSAELEQLSEVMDRVEVELKQWFAVIPNGLRSALEADFRALPSGQSAADRQQLSRRVQAAAALYSQIETLQNNFHITREVLDTGGSRRMVDVLYLGLGRAFAVSGADDWAAVGTPSAEGWNWVPQAKEAAAIRKAINIFNRGETAEIVNLPIQITAEVLP